MNNKVWQQALGDSWFSKFREQQQKTLNTCNIYLEYDHELWFYHSSAV